MYYWQEDDIKIDENSKILIGLGDSFTQGQGACSLDIWEKYSYDLNKMYNSENIDVISSNYENSWVKKLCKNHLIDYIPINLGMAGRGNRAAVKELHLHPELNLTKAKHKIVIFMISGMERFDFIHKEYNEHNHFKTVWPFMKMNNQNINFSEFYSKNIYNERFGVIELLLNIFELITWCKAYDAKLILTSAFNTTYNSKSLIKKIKGDFLENPNLHRERKRIESLVDVIKWDEFLYPNNYTSFSDFLLSLENRSDLIDPNSSWPFYEFTSKQEKLSPKGYLSKCGHPSYKGHEEIATILYDHIIKNKLDV